MHELTEKLEHLGFDDTEAKIYLSLLRLGESTAGPIVKSTGLHRQVVYDTLDKLKKRGFVLVTIKSNRKNFSASNPEKIVKDAQSKMALAKELIPELLSLGVLSRHKQEVRVFEGVEGFSAIHKSNIENQPEHTNMFVLGSTGYDWVNTMQKTKYFKKYEKTRIKKEINHHLIFFEKERERTKELIKKHYVKQPKKLQKIFRFLPDQFKSPVGIQIWHDNVTLIIYSQNILIIQIKNDLIVQNFKKHFEIMWGIAKC